MNSVIVTTKPLDYVIGGMQAPEQQREAEQPVVEIHAPPQPDADDEYRERQRHHDRDLRRRIGPEQARFVQGAQLGLRPDPDRVHRLVFARHVDAHVQLVVALAQLARRDDEGVRAHPAHPRAAARLAHVGEQAPVDEQRAALAQARQEHHPGLALGVRRLEGHAVPDRAGDSRPVLLPAVRQRHGLPGQQGRRGERVAREEILRLAMAPVGRRRRAGEQAEQDQGAREGRHARTAAT
jgi:hypothetical protein